MSKEATPRLKFTNIPLNTKILTNLEKILKFDVQAIRTNTFILTFT